MSYGTPRSLALRYDGLRNCPRNHEQLIDMNSPRAESQPNSFVSADWSKDPRKRSVYVADLSKRLIYREARPDWALGSLMALAMQLPEQGSVLVGVDLVLGVPQSYWELVLAEPRYGQPSTFIDWLGQLGDNREFFDPANVVKDHEQWRVDRPTVGFPTSSTARESCWRRLIRVSPTPPRWQTTAASANFQSTQKARAAVGPLSSGPQRAGAADAPPPADARQLRHPGTTTPGSRTRQTPSARRLR